MSEKRGGFEPATPRGEPPCSHPQHRPPMHLWVPPGTQYRHICPACGFEAVLRHSGVRFSA